MHPCASWSATLYRDDPQLVRGHESVIHGFEQANNAKVSFIKSGDAGAALNKAILSKSAPLADVFFGVDNTFLARALEAEIFEAYDSPALKDIPGEFQLDQHRISAARGLW